MLCANSATFNDSSNVINELQNLFSMIKEYLSWNNQNELKFQETEQKTYESFTDSFSEMLNKVAEIIRTNWEMMKEYIVKADNVVKRWLYADNVLDRVINTISQEIYISSAQFDTTIESIKMKEAYENDSLKEIEIVVKVSADMDINKLTQFWDYIGEKVDTIIDIERFSDTIKAKEIKERLLIVVSELD